MARCLFEGNTSAHGSVRLLAEQDRILLVEDDPIVAEVVRLALPEFAVTVAANREEAFIHLLGDVEWAGALVDLNLTKFSDFQGKDVLEYLNDTDIPRAVLTGAKGLGDIRRNFEERYGVSTVVIKGDQGIQLNDIRLCVARMRAESVATRREQANSELDDLFGQADDELQTELRELQSLAVRTRRIAGTDAADRMTKRETMLAAEKMRMLSEAKQDLQARLSSARTLQDVASIVQEAREAIRGA